MNDTLRGKVRTFFNRMMQATRVLPMAGFGQAEEPPTDTIHREGHLDEGTPSLELHEQQHVDVPARATGKRPRG